MTRRGAATMAAASSYRRARGRLGRFDPQSRTLLGLVVLTGVIVAAIVRWPDALSITLLLVPLSLASLFLGPRTLPWFVALVLAVLAFVLPLYDDLSSGLAAELAVIFLLGLVVLVTSFKRTRLGVPGSQGESMLLDLRDRIMFQARLPELPPDWQAEVALRSAGGTPFAGDFVVAVRSRGGRRLDAVVVDVSGRGIRAGTRALQLSGAFGGLLAALPPEQFLPAANDYLLRQQWEEGFATAAQVTLDLRTGAAELRSAGHPPAVRLTAGNGRWSVAQADGPALGLIPDAEFPPVTLMLQTGDALMLFTDGLVETASRDLQLGIDRLMGRALRDLRAGIGPEAAQRLVAGLGSRTDDRALLILHRRAGAAMVREAGSPARSMPVHDHPSPVSNQP